MATIQWDFIFGILGNIVSFMVYLAPLPTFYRIFKKKSTEGFQSIPYVVGLFSSLLWIYYALIKTNVILLITINSIGCFIQFAYICFFIFFAPKGARINTLLLFSALNVFGFVMIVLSTHFLLEGSNRVKIVGWISVAISLCVFIAPLCILRKVMRSKSVEYMPFLLSFFLTLGAVMWFFYGLLRRDYNVAIPNVFGFLLGVVQMGVYMMYRNVKKNEDENHVPAQEDTTTTIDELKIPAEF